MKLVIIFVLNLSAFRIQENSILMQSRWTSGAIKILYCNLQLAEGKPPFFGQDDKYFESVFHVEGNRVVQLELADDERLNPMGKIAGDWVVVANR